MNRIHALVAAIFVLLVGTASRSFGAEAAPAAATPSRYTFSWPLSADPSLGPRGGSTRGPQMTFDTRPSAAWQALQANGLSDFERDRRAILAMAGGYRVAFDFLEVADFRAEPKRDRPYQSWGTEYVYVAADRGTFISLQHLLVMRIVGRDGKVTEPFVTKHWRQDWTYQDTEIVEYSGINRWQRRTLPPERVQGTWSQAVYQVDDSPRYESLGRWQHSAGASTWISGETWRPLPRREWSVRKDYNLLIGTNRHTVIATGWLQEENNVKAVIDAAGTLDATLPYLAREYGVARYERIRDYDFTAGDRYFERTRSFWEAVRAAWDRRFAASPSLTLVAAVDQADLYVPFFERAEAIAQNPSAAVDANEQGAFIERTIDALLVKGSPAR
ncbi:MAG: hypothetical protein RLZZ403_935 [Pseudomonadota bacterium]|jgi:hypothetical protein